MSEPGLALLVTDLAKAQIGGTFNQYRETGGDDASPLSPRLRRHNLLHYLQERRRARVLLVAEAAGWRGARYSGLCLRSERQIDEATTALRRTSRHPLGWCERSSTVVQSALAPWSGSVLLWNAVPTHPRRDGGDHTNRPPTRQEVEAGAALLWRLIAIVQPEHVAAIGRSAASALGLDVPLVRHPARGGAQECRRGLRLLLTSWLGSP
jgi:Uracil DNA glycosylase superfamily